MKLNYNMRAMINQRILEERELNDPATRFGASFELIEGCCPDSADEIAETVAKELNIKIHHYPADSGNYLKRNVEMVLACDSVLAFWDGWSYGTAHTIANAVMMGKDVNVFKVKKQCFE